MNAPTGRCGPTMQERLVCMLALGKVGVVAALVAAAAFFWLLQPAFLSASNIHAILGVVSFVGIIAIGQTILLVGGEFMLVRALALRPAVLMPDKPTASLSGAEVDRLMLVLRRLRAPGVTMIYITHRLAEVTAVCDRATVLRDGAVAAEFAVRASTSTR